MKAPFKILYSNDLTHIGYCISPYHQRGETFTKAMLDASVDETAGTGVDVHMLQPGFGWVPMWQSKIVSPEKHWAWLQKTYNVQVPNHYLQYLLEGSDIVGDFTKRCRLKKISPFISIRMNDAHLLDMINNQELADAHVSQIGVCQFYHEHPEYRLDTTGNSWQDRGQNWAIPEVREYKYQFIRELCENYDLDGIELDFMRFPSLFRSFETTPTQREEIMTAFVYRVRKLLDETANGKPRWLSVRLPIEHDMRDSLGMSISKLADAGVDIFNLSYYFYTSQNGDLEEIRSQAKDAAMFVEMTSCASVGRSVKKADGDTFEFMKTTDGQFYTTVQSAYDAGMDGVSLFNFMYYREHGATDKKGITREPPFEIIKHFRDPAFLASQPAHYFIGTHWEDDGPLPKCMMLFGKYTKLSFRNVSSVHDAPNALLRVYIDVDSSKAGDWEVWFNDRPVKMASYSTLPVKTVEREGKVLAWKIPPSLIVQGQNDVVFRSKDTQVSIIGFVELIVWK